MVFRKTRVSENVWSDLEISGAIFEVSFSGDFCVPQSRIFLSTSLGVMDLSFCLPFGLQESNFSEFMGTAYKSNSTSKLRQ